MYLTIKDIIHSKREAGTVTYHFQRQPCIDYGSAGRKRKKPFSTLWNLIKRVYTMSGTITGRNDDNRKNRREVAIGMTGTQTFIVTYENNEVIEGAVKKNHG
jgi:hypothetical protein